MFVRWLSVLDLENNNHGQLVAHTQTHIFEMFGSINCIIIPPFALS